MGLSGAVFFISLKNKGDRPRGLS